MAGEQVREQLSGDNISRQNLGQIRRLAKFRQIPPSSAREEPRVQVIGERTEAGRQSADWGEFITQI